MPEGLNLEAASWGENTSNDNLRHMDITNSIQ